MIASDTLSFARSVAKDLDYAHLKRSEHVKHLSSGKRIVNSGDDAGALSGTSGRCYYGVFGSPTSASV